MNSKIKSRFLTGILLILILAVVGMGTSQAAEGQAAYEFGSFMTEGGKSYPAHMVGGDIVIKDLTNFTLKQRIGYFSVRNKLGNFQGLKTSTLIQITLAPSWWDLYIASKTGIIHQVLDGGDKDFALFGFESGVSLFGKPIDLAIGIEFIPQNTGNDNQFAYMLLNFHP